MEWMDMMRRANILARRFTIVLGIITAMTVASAPAIAITLEEEIDLGKKIDAEILKEYPQITDEAELKQINELGQKLINGGSVRRPEIKYHFRILKQDELNAFSTPGGYVYFSSHLWEILRPDERKGVLAHEIVHTDRRHALDAMSKARRRTGWITGALILLGANRDWQNVTGLLHNIYTLKYSRGDERQADEIGTQLLYEAGYDPAGLLLSMRKIGRFQAEAGGEPPKILSNHPPTKERLDYLTALLNKMGVPIPPENVKDIPNPNRVGQVTSIGGDRVQFSSSKKLKTRDIVWLMGQGWDYKYENHIEVPIARGVVTGTGNTYAAQIAIVPGTKPEQLGNGTGVYSLPAPEPASGVASIETSGKIVSKSSLTKLDRLLAVQQVWDDEADKVINGNAGYAIITNPQSSTGYVAVTRPRYAYAPVAAGSVLVKLSDPNAKRWVGPIISIGRGGGTIEVLPSRALDPRKTYEVAYPAWNPKDKYENRVIGTAKLSQSSGKIVMHMTTYMPGYGISNIQTGFDVYEEPLPKAGD
jgi:hypothetical protein